MLLEVVAPELSAQRGIPQNKIDAEDLWDHTLRTVDAVPATRPVVRLAALVHDLGKPATLADGHFHHHDVVGARIAESMLRRLRFPRPVIPGAHSRLHKTLGWASAADLTLTSVTGLWFYYAAFVA